MVKEQTRPDQGCQRRSAEHNLSFTLEPLQEALLVLLSTLVIAGRWPDMPLPGIHVQNRNRPGNSLERSRKILASPRHGGFDREPLGQRTVELPRKLDRDGVTHVALHGDHRGNTLPDQGLSDSGQGIDTARFRSLTGVQHDEAQGSMTEEGFQLFMVNPASFATAIL